jgi:hypothetical protein
MTESTQPEQQATAPAQPAQTIAGFKQALATALIALTENGRLRKSELTTVLDRSGVSPYTPDGKEYRVQASAEHVTFTAGEQDEHAPLPKGVEAADLTAEAIARLDAAYLVKLRKQAWTEIRYRIDRGDFDRSRGVQALRDLGFGEENLPKMVTSVSGYLQSGANQYGEPVNRQFSFPLDGEHEKAVVTERLQAAAPELPEAALIRAAFPEVADKALPQAVTMVEVYTSSKWNAYTE